MKSKSSNTRSQARSLLACRSSKSNQSVALARFPSFAGAPRAMAILSIRM